MNIITNFTEESCNVTATTIELLGAASGRIPFSASFNDGDLVSYQLIQADGARMVAGVGKYVAATDDITRQDFWNYDGTNVNENPATNITFTGGPHTVVCAPEVSLLMGMLGISKSAADSIYSRHWPSAAGFTTANLVVDQQYSLPFHLDMPAEVSQLKIRIGVAAAGSLTQIGLSRLIDGVSESTYLESGSVDSTVAADEVIYSFAPRILNAGWYMTHIVSDAAIGVEVVGERATGWTPIADIRSGNRHGVGQQLYKAGVTGGVLDADPSSVVEQQFNTPNLPMIRLG